MGVDARGAVDDKGVSVGVEEIFEGSDDGDGDAAEGVKEGQSGTKVGVLTPQGRASHGDGPIRAGQATACDSSYSVRRARAAMGASILLLYTVSAPSDRPGPVKHITIGSARFYARIRAMLRPAGIGRVY